MVSKIVVSEEDILGVIRDIKMVLLEVDVNLKVVKDFVVNVKEKVFSVNLVGIFNVE